MIPVASSTAIPGRFIERVGSPDDKLRDYENGGPSIGVASSDSTFEWTAFSDGSTVWVEREGVAPIVVLSDVAITEIGLAFDQTMNPHIAYVAGGVSKFFYWDSLAGAYATMVLTGARSPRCCSDEKDPMLSADRDLIVAYMVGSELRGRIQRDRYLVEYMIEGGHGSKNIIAIGMATGWRMQYRLTS